MTKAFLILVAIAGLSLLSGKALATRTGSISLSARAEAGPACPLAAMIGKGETGILLLADQRHCRWIKILLRS
jgi:hypothetical protein